jgi:hypothetical protein
MAFYRVDGQPTAGGPNPETTTLMLNRVSGTDDDGVWQGSMPMAAVFDGTWQAGDICGQQSGGGQFFFDPRDQGITSPLTVAGTHQPLLTMGFSPQPLHRGDALTVYGTVVDTATGHGMPGAPVVIGTSSNDCGLGRLGTVVVQTTSTARYSYVDDATAPGLGYELCSTMILPSAQPIGSYPGREFDDHNQVVARITSQHPRVQFAILSVHPGSKQVVHGTNVEINGSIWPGVTYGRVLLQRLISGSWHTVNSAGVRESGRYTIVATPPTAGTWTYRVQRLSDSCYRGRCDYIGTVSPQFTLTAT